MSTFGTEAPELTQLEESTIPSSSGSWVTVASADTVKLRLWSDATEACDPGNLLTEKVGSEDDA